MEYLSEKNLNTFIDSALIEDVGDGDHTTLSTIPADSTGKAKLLVKEEGIIAGIDLAQKIFQRIQPDLVLDVLIEDGQKVKKGDICFIVSGKVHTLLTGERLVLNCMQRMSGIASHTARLINIIEGTGARLLDTRKTTPNFRIPEKWAVKIGGGINHRFGLYDMIMIKDNHIDFAGGIKEAIQSAKNYLKKTGRNLKIEVETRNLEEVKEVLEEGGVDRILLDNMNLQMLKEAVILVNGKTDTEASGGITEETIRKIAETGVTYISVGALTHTIKSMDLSLKADF